MVELQIQKENKAAIMEKLPEVANLDVLCHKADQILLKGLRTLDEVMDYAEEYKDRISAVNATVNFGKYLEVRKANMGKNNTDFIDDFEEVYGSEEE